jgi:hypothetical protein
LWTLGVIMEIARPPANKKMCPGNVGCADILGCHQLAAAVRFAVRHNQAPAPPVAHVRLSGTTAGVAVNHWPSKAEHLAPARGHLQALVYHAPAPGWKQ